MHPDNTLTRPRCAVRSETVYGQVADTRREWLLLPHAQYELAGRNTSVLADGCHLSPMSVVFCQPILQPFFFDSTHKSFPPRILVRTLPRYKREPRSNSPVSHRHSLLSRCSGGRILQPPPCGPLICLKCSCLTNCFPHVCSARAQHRSAHTMA